MRSILITGCNRGLGLGLVQNLVKRANRPEVIIATCRDPEKAKDLQNIAKEHKNIHILILDLTNLGTYDKFAEQVSGIVKKDGLNVLFNNAGVSQRFCRLPLTNAEDIINTFKTNTVAPIMLTKAMLPLLKTASESNSSLPLGSSRAAVVNMSSVLASVKMNADGGYYPYRCSKAALNMATVSLSVDMKKDKIMAVALHPGWVKTSMGGPKAPMDVDTSTNSLIDLLYKLNKSHNGGFYQYDGEQLPW